MFLITCGSQESSTGEVTTEDTLEEYLAEQEETSNAAPKNTALIIQHEAEDFGAWKVKLDKHKSAGEESDMSDWALLTERDNPNEVNVIEKVGDMEATKVLKKPTS